MRLVLSVTAPNSSFCNTTKRIPVHHPRMKEDALLFTSGELLRWLQAYPKLGNPWDFCGSSMGILWVLWRPFVGNKELQNFMRLRKLEITCDARTRGG
jgi:hypothetical protein